jgi:hypothetical protein
MFRFKAELRRQARELDTEEARIIREQNSRRRAERRAEVTQEERIQAQEITAAHKTVSRKRRALRFLSTAIS